MLNMLQKPALLGGVPGSRGVYLVRGVPGAGRGVYLPGRGVRRGVPGPEGCTCLGGHTCPGGCTCLGVPAQVLPPVNRMTDRCKHITLPQTLFAGGNYKQISCEVWHSRPSLNVVHGLCTCRWSFNQITASNNF